MVTYNSSETIGACLRSILSQSLKPGAVLVVDNHSLDQTVSVVRHDFPNLQVVENKSNRGFGAACNLGLSVLSEEFAALVNPDARLSEDWSSQIMTALQAHPKCGAAEGRILLVDRTSYANSDGSYVNLAGFGCTRGYGKPVSWLETPRPSSYPSGAACIIRRRAFEEAGGFDESYFLYHEDVDLGLRIRSVGWDIEYIPTAVAYHHHTPEMGATKLRLLERNRWFTIAKLMPVGYFIMAGPLLLVIEVGIALDLLKRRRYREKARAILEFATNLPDVLAQRRREMSRRMPSWNPVTVMTDDLPEVWASQSKHANTAASFLRHYYTAFVGGGRTQQPMNDQGWPT